MALNLDPITGLPTDFLAPDLYQIPLSSRPQLAPEWSPDHLPPNALHPDNMPSMFATVQAQNSLNPGLPQALTTDGKGNLNVNAVGGGGGGGGGLLPYGATNGDADWSTATSETFFQRVNFMEHPATIWRLQAIAALDVSSVNMNQPVYVRVSLQGFPHGTTYFVGMMVFIQRPGGTSINTTDVQVIDIVYPGGWSTLPFLAPGDNGFEMDFECYNGFINTVAGTVEYS